MKKCLAKADNLSSLLDTQTGVEIMLEPYRLQPSVIVGVAYSEFLAYVRSLTASSQIRLISGNSRLVDFASNNNPQLYNCFLSNVAFAICKEIFYAEMFYGDGTVILPATASGASEMPLVVFLHAFPATKSQKTEWDIFLQNAGWFTTIRRQSNQRLKELAYCLYAASLKPVKFEGELNLGYTEA